MTRIEKRTAFPRMGVAEKKLSRKQVEEIRARYAAGGVTQAQLAKEYGVSAPNISLIVTNKAWKTPPPLEQP